MKIVTLGVNMCRIPSTEPLRSRARTRKQINTTYGNRELKYITCEKVKHPVKRHQTTTQYSHSAYFKMSFDVYYVSFSVTYHRFID